MPGLLIRDLPEDVHRKLKERAARNRRSLAKEALVILETALGGVSGMEEPQLPVSHKGDFPLVDEWIDQARREGRR